ncbi:AMP-binding protein [Actinomadura sp. 9N407]|uniref:AMP-binding protein n=1 Tax=Actinomadura sp. 9N407 TaxID=3375154 RepID=UPI003789AD65
MRDWTISTTGMEPISAHTYAARLAPSLTTPTPRRTCLLTGDHQPGIATLGAAALTAGHQVALLPTGPQVLAPPGIGLHLQAGQQPPQPASVPGDDVRDRWDLALFSSGSTTGRPRGYGFTLDQLDTVTGWYQTIYQATADTIIVTALPAAYNFTFIAGGLLASRLGARLHLVDAFPRVLQEATRLAPAADRVIVLANPVVLDQADPSPPPTGNLTIDSGGAPLSSTAITDYRTHGIDVREGYGLTETASLTHFDTTPAAPPGTVGTAMPGVTTIINNDAHPLLQLASPALALPLDPAEPATGPLLQTTDLGRIDETGRLRLLGRADDHPVNGYWPRDTLDALGPILGRRCAMVRHPSPDQVTVHTLTPLSATTRTALAEQAADLLGIPPSHITITAQRTPLLHSAKLPRWGAHHAPP